MRNWKREVDDCDFFDIFANGNNTTKNEAKAFLKKYFSLETLAKCDSVSVERVRDKADDEGRIVDFSLGRCSTDGPRMVPLLLARGSNKVAADILGLLKDGPKSPSELHEALGLSSANYLIQKTILIECCRHWLAYSCLVCDNVPVRPLKALLVRRPCDRGSRVVEKGV